MDALKNGIHCLQFAVLMITDFFLICNQIDKYFLEVDQL